MKLYLIIPLIIISPALHARTGSISGDSIVLWLPLSILFLIWLVTFVKKKYQERKQGLHHIDNSDIQV